MNFGVLNVVDSKEYLLLECLVLHIFRCVKLLELLIYCTFFFLGIYIHVYI